MQLTTFVLARWAVVAGMVVLMLAAPVLAVSSAWDSATGGDWSDTGRWDNGVPNGSGDTATLGDAIAAQATVSRDVNVTLGVLNFDDNGTGFAYTLGGPSRLDLSGAAQLNVATTNTAAHEIAGLVRLLDNATITNDGGAELTLSGPVESNPFGSRTHTVSGSSKVTFGSMAWGGNGDHTVTLQGSGNELEIGAITELTATRAPKLSIQRPTTGGADTKTILSGVGSTMDGSLTIGADNVVEISGDTQFERVSLGGDSTLILKGANPLNGPGRIGIGFSQSATVEAGGAVPIVSSMGMEHGGSDTIYIQGDQDITFQGQSRLAWFADSEVHVTNTGRTTFGDIDWTGNGRHALVFTGGGGTLDLAGSLTFDHDPPDRYLTIDRPGAGNIISGTSTQVAMPLAPSADTEVTITGSANFSRVFIPTGAGRVVLAGPNPLTNPTMQISLGNGQSGNVHVTGSDPVVVAGGLRHDGVGTLAVTGDQDVTFQGLSEFSRFNETSLEITNTGKTTLGDVAWAGNTDRTLFLTGTGGDLEITGSLSHIDPARVGALVIDRPDSTVILSGTTGTYRGATQVRALSTLVITHPAALGTSENGTSSTGDPHTREGSTLVLEGNMHITDEVIRILGGGVNDRGALVNRGNNTVDHMVFSQGTPAEMRITSETGTLTLNGDTGTPKFHNYPLYMGGHGDIVMNGVIEDAFENRTIRLIKEGDGTLTLANANLYEGGTSIDGGTVLATNTTGSATGPGSVTLHNGTLGGDGTIAGNVTTAGPQSIVAPGTSPGTLTLEGALNAGNGATFVFDLGAPGTGDLLVIEGLFTAPSGSGQLIVDIFDAGGLGVGGYELISFASATGLELSDFALGQTPPDFEGQLQVDLNAGMVQLDVTRFGPEPPPSDAIPEPAGLVLLALAGVGLLGRRRQTRPSQSASSDS